MAGRLKRTVAITETEYTDTVFYRFITEKEAIGLVSKTIQQYKDAYKKFSTFFGDEAERIGDIYGAMFPTWTAAMRKEGLATASINSYLSAMRSFMYWCMEPNHEYLNEHFKVRLIRAQETPPKDYTNEEIKLLIKKPDKKARFLEWRSWAMACFALGTGARIGTMAEIQIKDVDLKNAKVFYRHTKSKRLQNANLPPQLIRVLTEYINTWRTVDTQLEDYLFCGINGEKANIDTLRQGYGVFAKSRGVNKTSIHGLRHTFARIWFENGGDVVQLSKILGHTTLTMSEHYMNAFSDMAKERFIAYNPLETIGRKGAKKGVKKNDD